MVGGERDGGEPVIDTWRDWTRFGWCPLNHIQAKRDVGRKEQMAENTKVVKIKGKRRQGNEASKGRKWIRCQEQERQYSFWFW